MEKAIVTMKQNSVNKFSHFAAHIRKNHALEHATIHVLEEKRKKSAFGGYSFINGFWIVGETGIQEIQEAVDIAHARLIHGESSLAIHPACGTNLVIAGLCSTVASYIALSGANTMKEKLNRFSTMVMFGGAASCIAKPLGLRFQEKLTTDPNVERIKILGISSSKTVDNQPIFFIETQLLP